MCIVIVHLIIVSEISQKMMDETCELNLKFTDFIDMKPKTKTNIKKKK